MTFGEFLRDKEILDAKTYEQFDMIAQMGSDSFYQTIRRDLSSVGGTEEELMDLFCEYDKEFGILYTSKGLTVDMDVIKLLGGTQLITSLKAMPLRDREHNLLLVFYVPDERYNLSLIQQKLERHKYKKYVCTEDLWLAMWSIYMSPIMLAAQASKLSSIQTVTNETQSQTSEAKSLFMQFIIEGYQMRASDIHFIPCSNHCDLQYRVDGVNFLYCTIPSDVLSKVNNLLRQNVASAKPYQPIDGKLSYRMPTDGKNVDLRFSIIPGMFGADINIRFLSNEKMTFEELGMTPVNIQRYKSILDLPQGLVVMVGPTGSGKTTTLYSGLSYIRESMANIIAIEDPVEITMEGITQINVSSANNDEIGHLTFPEALKASLRHDPDVIVVGEIRDNATAEEALRAATTGHLVIASLHTNDSISVIERLRHMGLESYALGEVLVAIMGQRLVRRLCPKCKEEYVFTVGHADHLKWGLPEGKTYTLYKPVGCEYCSNKGYRGRIAINEILEVDTDLRDLIQRHVMRSEIEQYLSIPREDGSSKFVSMYSDGMHKVISGVTSLAELERLARDRTAFKGGRLPKKIVRPAAVDKE